jgi:hypothetical protein
MQSVHEGLVELVLPADTKSFSWLASSCEFAAFALAWFAV